MSKNTEKKDLKSELLKAALQAIRKKGAHAMTLRGVARRAGCSAMATYRHFESKEALMAEISRQGFEVLTQQINLAVENNPDDPMKQLGETGTRYVATALRNPEHVLMMFGGFVRDHSHYPELEKTARTSFDKLVEIMKRGQEKKLFPAGDPIVLALNAWTSVHGLSMLLINGQLEFLGINEKNYHSYHEKIGELMLTGLCRAL
jgi:AcrR family transcriptional regulator